LNPDSGEEYWSESVEPGYGMSILPPVSDGRLLFVAGESRTSAMFRLNPDTPAAELLWRGGPKDSLYLATSNAIFDGGFIYGADISSGSLVCFEAESGERKWQSAVPTTGSDRGRGEAHGSAFLIKCDDGYLILSETGDLIHAELSAAGYKEIARFHALDPTTKTMGRTALWTYPAIAGKYAYVRNDQEIVCFEIGSVKEI
jgi:outer membrane protein assembly factor BamB